MQFDNVIVEYRDRPEGSESKLNTYSDGFKVLGTIVRLFKNYKPFAFFSTIATILSLIAFGFMIPVLIIFFQTHMVPNFPTLIACGFVFLAAIQAFFAGMILSNMSQNNRRMFELDLVRAENEFKKLSHNISQQ